jgi:hypothetical protein
MKALLSAALVLLCWQAVAAEQFFVIPRDNPWDSWEYPRGLVRVDSAGVRVKRFSGRQNALTDAADFTAKAIGVHGTQIARTATNGTRVDRVRDGSEATWWQPSQASPLTDWWIELDLKRVVLATRVRLVFPDTAAARPFRFFSVYTSPGLEITAAPGSIYFDRVGGTVKANSDRVVEYALTSRNESGAAGAFLQTDDLLPFAPIRFVRFVAEGTMPDAALAEIQVETMGENIALKAADWGGTISASPRSAGVEKLISGDLSTQGGWGIEHNAGRQEGWRVAGMWFKLDMLSTFRIDRIVWLPVVQNASPWFYAMDNDRQVAWEGTTFTTSDGTPGASVAGGTPEEGDFSYEMLSEINNEIGNRAWIFDLQFPARPVRLLFWHYDRRLSFGWTRALQVFVYHAEGYPARVAMTSAAIDFGSARSISRVEWRSEQPPGTEIQVQTKTGNTFDTIKHYFAKQGTQEVEVTEEKYRKLPKVSQGKITEEIRPGADWSDWSELHPMSGTAFMSPTPRRYLQARVFLSSQDPDAMPVLRDLSFVYNPPLIANGLLGEVQPHVAQLDSLTAFAYTLWPQFSASDPGFDQIALQVPGTPVNVSATVAGRPVELKAMEQQHDTLVVQLPQRVQRDSVTVHFQTRLMANPTVIGATVRNTAQPGVWQGVVARTAAADKVVVPEVYQRRSFVFGLTCNRAFSPDGDGTNDQFELVFGLLRTEAAPRVTVFRLDGSVVAQLEPAVGTGPLWHYTWDGMADSGARVAPGLYLVRVQVRTDAGDEDILRPVGVAY